MHTYIYTVACFCLSIQFGPPEFLVTNSMHLTGHILSAFPHHPRMGTTILNLAALSAGIIQAANQIALVICAVKTQVFKTAWLAQRPQDTGPRDTPFCMHVCVCVYVYLSEGGEHSPAVP